MYIYIYIYIGATSREPPCPPGAKFVSLPQAQALSRVFITPVRRAIEFGLQCSTVDDERACLRRPLRQQEAIGCIPEIDTSEIIVDLWWRFQTDFQWHLPTEFHLSVVVSQGLSLSRWILTGNVQWTFGGIFQRSFTFATSGV